MSFHNNATHVIQKIIVCIDHEKRQFLNDVLRANLKALCLNSNGICVVKKLINQSKSDDMKTKMSAAFSEDCLEIVQSPFGNYAIQHVFEV